MSKKKSISSELLEAKQKPIPKLSHRFINNTVKRKMYLTKRELNVGLAYIAFIDEVDLKDANDSIDGFDQVIFIFKSKATLKKFLSLRDEIPEHVNYFYDTRPTNEAFKLALDLLSSTFVMIDTFSEELAQRPNVDIKELPNGIYETEEGRIYPSYLMRRIPLYYYMNRFFKSFVDSYFNHSPNLMSMRLDSVDRLYENHIKINTIDDIKDALHVISAIYNENVLFKENIEYEYEANKLIHGIRSYIDEHPEESQFIVNLIEKTMDRFNFRIINKDQAETLVIAYCFPPYIDTSGNVMAKRIRSKKEIVDVISNDMSRIRKHDDRLYLISNHLIDNHFLLKAKQAFSSWESISGFVEQGLDIYSNNNKHYNNLYSRAMFPQSHFLAFEIKELSPEINWRAEFSDPLHSTVTSDIRYSPIQDEAYIDRVSKLVHPLFRPLIDDNVFNICEILALSHADELIFTNENQLEYMLMRFDEEIQESVKNRAIISRHPIPKKEEYHVVPTNYTVDSDYINLGYFGNFYATRGFNEIELVCKYLENKGETQFRIHCFTNLTSHVKNMHKNSDYKEYIVLKPFVGFYEFLNVTTLFDALLLFDAHTEGIKPLNPYVPSKLSDYKGSGSNVWAFTEQGSVLDQDEDIIRTNLTDYEHYIDGFNQIKSSIQRHLPVLESKEGE